VDTARTNLSSAESVVSRIERAVAVLVRRAESIRQAQPEPEQLLRSAYLLLAELERRGPMGVAALANSMELDVSTVSRQVIPLDQQGLVHRLSNPNDGRMSVIEITPEGVTQLTRTRDRRHAVYADILQDWSADDRAALASYLERLNASAARIQNQT